MLDSAMEYIIILASILTIILIKLRITPRRQPIFNVYQQPSRFYWLKVAFMYSILSLRKYKEKIKNNQGKTNGPTDEELDRPQNLSYHDKAVDAVYFNAGNSQGDYLVTATARRKNKLVDGFLFLKIANSNLGVLEMPKVPSTALYKTEDNDEYSAEGLNISPVVAMKKWKITYDGKLKSSEDLEQIYDVHVDLDWISDLPYFNFDTDMDSLAMAKNMAVEPWSREYFEILKDSHQTHYEQFGTLKGTAVVDGKQYSLNLDSCRDHSFGKKREWESFHRYGLHFITAENGDRFAVSKISVPVMFSRPFNLEKHPSKRLIVNGIIWSSIPDVFLIVSNPLLIRFLSIFGLEVQLLCISELSCPQRSGERAGQAMEPSLMFFHGLVRYCCVIDDEINLNFLDVGYVYSNKDKKLYPVQSCDLELYQHGEDGNPPTDYAFSFVAGNRYYTMQIHIVDSPFFYISKDWESKVIERLCTAEINGMKGWGIAEWQYRNIAGKKVCENKN